MTKFKMTFIAIFAIAGIVGVLIYFIKMYFYPLSYFDIIKQEASKNNLDPYLVLAIIKAESGFQENATSHKEARGLMQMIHSTANEVNDKMNILDEISEEDLYRADINIALGCHYFASLIERYHGNYYLAICAYNAGMGNVDKWLNEGILSYEFSNTKEVSLPFKETEKYLAKVLSNYHMYRFLY